MFQEVRIKNLRGLEDFSMRSLGRVNLLVGTNNSGKTSVLEGIEILASRDNPKVIVNTASRRGERLWFEDDYRRTAVEADISHLFFGHNCEFASQITIEAKSGAGSESVELLVVAIESASSSSISKMQPTFPGMETDDVANQRGLKIAWNTSKSEEIALFPISPRGGVSLRNWSRRPSDAPVRPRVQFVSTAALSIEDVLALFDEIVLTPEESLLLEALRTIEPSIERIASVGSERSRLVSGSRQGGIVIKTSDAAQRIPIGSMGDGIWRMLGIALALVNAEKGLLLVDEIDTGLHYSVLSKMWKLVKTTAERLDVQVFATTHSRDCYESLASIAREEVGEGSAVTIQRIERGATEAIAYSESEIVAAAERGIEVR